MNKALLWDMDGVLADSGDAHFVAWQEMLHELGREISRQEFDDTFGMANTAILERWLGATVAPERSAALARRKEALFRQHLDRVRLLPGVLDWLAYARSQGYYQVVASSGEMANIVAVVHALGVGNYFHGIVSGAFLPQSKPHPAVFLQAAAAVAAEPRHCLVLEDGIVGVEAARRAGMRCIAVTTTHAAERLAGADRIVSSLAELPPATMDAHL
ncbi:MAG: HAD family hydrolase [Anaerolineae bacterium]|jgi:HAD superfamily hydrolase (TIGR01509 family)